MTTKSELNEKCSHAYIIVWEKRRMWACKGGCPLTQEQDRDDSLPCLDCLVEWEQIMDEKFVVSGET